MRAHLWQKVHESIVMDLCGPLSLVFYGLIIDESCTFHSNTALLFRVDFGFAMPVKCGVAS